MKQIYRFIYVGLVAVFLAFVPLNLWGALFKFIPTTVTNPDGSKIECFASGDEFFNWLHDKDGYTIIQSKKDGYYYYGMKNQGQVIASQHRANKVNPGALGLKPWAKISEEAYAKKRKTMEENIPQLSMIEMAQKTGELNNLVVYIRFADDSEFELTRQTYDNKFNPETGTSLKSYFKEASYDKIMINSSHYPVCDISTNLSYQDFYNRSYYQPYNSSTNPGGYDGETERRIREHQLLVNAINSISNEVPTDLNIDNDNNGLVDNVCFIVRGNHDAWADLLWAHRWSLYSQTVYINGKRVYDYTFQPENQNSVRTLCHEMFHVLGAPDLYHYSSNGIYPVAYWDIMEYGNGHMGAYMKWKYSGNQWIESIPEITASGTYSLNPLSSPVNNCFKIKSPNSTNEFFIVEYRQKTGTFEGLLPGSGLLVYRINSSYTGNASGPPDEVYIYRLNGTTNINGSYNSANFSSNVGRTEINDGTNPSSFLTDGSPGGLDISDISTAGSTISFYYSNSTVAPTADFIASSTNINQGGSVNFTDLSSDNPSTWNWQFDGGTPSTSSKQNPIVTYNSPGTYNVALTVSNTGGSDTELKTGYITINVVAPVADFIADATEVSENTSVTFTDHSANFPTSWNWQFPGGTPSTSTSQNPTIVYSTPGTYSVTLFVSNVGGSSTEVKTDYITVIEPTYCFSTGSAGYEWIKSVSLNSQTNPSGSSGDTGYEDFTGFVFSVNAGNTVSLSLSPEFAGRSKGEYWAVWIDYNEDKDFEDAGEFVFDALRKRSTVNGTFIIPQNINCTTLMRISMSRSGVAGPCEVFSQGEVEDYTIEIAPYTEPALSADFSAATTTVVIGESVQFFDESTGNPTSWSWNFEGGNPSGSGIQNPVIQYNSNGEYTVSLTVSDGNSSDGISKTGFITVVDAVTEDYCIPLSVTSDDYIAGVNMGSINNTTSGSGWSYDAGNYALNQGENYPVTLTPANAKNRNFWRIWIDFNGDGDFEDSDETVLVLNNKKGEISGSVNIPSYASGSTRMRISMRTGSSPAPCDDGFSGEVEDYLIDFGAGQTAFKSASFENHEINKKTELLVYPIPTENKLHLQLGK